MDSIRYFFENFTRFASCVSRMLSLKSFSHGTCLKRSTFIQRTHTYHDNFLISINIIPKYN